MIPQSIQYFVIVVHYGDIQATQALAADLTHQTQPYTHLIIIDNQGNYPKNSSAHVHTINPRDNVGYGGAINLGLGFAYHLGAKPVDIIVCLNNDSRMHPDTLATLANLLVPGKPPIVAATIGQLNLITGRTHLDNSSYPSSWHLSYPDGACFASRLDTFAHLQGFPDQFFLYWEDVVFGLKAQLRHYAIQRLPSHLIIHQPNHTPSQAKLYYLVRNGAYVLNHLAFPWGIYWTIINRFRLIYHRLRYHTTIATALSDASKAKLGVQHRV